MFLWKLIFQNVAKYLTQNFVNKTKSVWPEGKAETYFSFFPCKNDEIFYGVPGAKLSESVRNPDTKVPDIAIEFFCF